MMKRMLDPLVTQMRRAKAERGYRSEDLARETGLSRHTVDQALRKGSEGMSAETAALLGDALRLDPVHVATVWFRDRLVAAANKAEESKSDGLNRAIKQIRKIWSWCMTEYTARGTGRRLAFRSLRSEHEVTIEALASEVVRDGKYTERQTRDRIRLFEADRIRPQQEEIAGWLNGLSKLEKKPIRPGELDDRGRELLKAHFVNDTMDWMELRDNRTTSRVSYVKCPEGCKVELGRSKTIHGAVDIEHLKVSQQPPLGRVQVVARHDGLEIAVLLNGKVHFTISDEPFQADCSKSEHNAKKGVVYDRPDCEEGDVLVFPSGRFHRLCVKSRQCEVITINLRGNVMLGRRQPVPRHSRLFR